ATDGVRGGRRRTRSSTGLTRSRCSPMTDTGWERSGRRPWLLATARRVSADALRARRKDLLRHADLDDLTIGVPDGTEGADRRHDLVAARTTLPPLDREARTLITWHDLTHAEAAVVMDCSTPAFGVRV